MGRKQTKKELVELLDSENAIKELEAENRELVSLLKMLETYKDCWCAKSVARDNLIRAGLEVKHSNICKILRRYFLKQ